MASSVTATSATLNGTVNPNGDSTSYYFEYGTTSSYGANTTAQSAGSGTTVQSVQAAVGPLGSPGTIYHYRIVASNSGGPAYGNDQTFQTLTQGTVPTVQTQPATSIGTSTATLNAQITDNGRSSILERRFSWGTTSACADGFTAGVTVTGSTFSYNLAEIPPGIYYFQAWARNSTGWGNSTATSFNTLSSAPGPVSWVGISSGCNGDSPEITINWTAATGATSYTVLRNGISLQTGLTGTTFEDTSVAGGNSYSYFVQAWNAGGFNQTTTSKSATAPNDCGSGTPSINGQVFDGSTGSSLSGATVQVSGVGTTMTSLNGSFNFSSVAANNYSLTVSKAGYGVFSGTISVASGSSPFQTIQLFPTAVSGSSPAVTSVSSKYSGTLYFLDGISFQVTFMANVDWAGHPAGTVKFITPKDGTFQVNASGTTASQTIDVGGAFGPGGQLQIQAVSSDGTASVGAVANFIVMPTIPNANLQVEDNGSTFSYHSTLATPNFTFLNDSLPSGVSFNSDIPLFGDNPFGLTYLPSLDATVNGNHAQYHLEFSSGSASSLLSFNLAGQELDLTPQLNVAGNYDIGSGWKWNGNLGVQGDLETSKSWPFTVPTPVGPIPMFARADIKLSADATLDIVNLDPVKLNGTLELAPTITGTLGVGVDDVAAVAGWIQGQADFTFQYPQTPILQRYQLQLSVGGTEYAHLWILNVGASQTWHTWTWPNSGAALALQNLLKLNASDSTTPYPRSYLNQQSYATFNGHPNSGIHPLIPIPTSSQNPLLYSLQTRIFPFSESSISASETNCYAVWLYDDPSRQANNQTMLVFSKISGTQWTDPVPMADDGTADFHPQLRTFADGSAVVAWENGGTVLSSNATLTDVTTNLEIATAFYDAKLNQWQPMQKITANAYLDRTPRIAGPSQTNFMLVWAANTNNASEGSSTDPNQLWFVVWNGSTWSAPQIFAEVPYPLLRYDMAYDGSNGYVVMSLDADNTLTNLNAHELFEVAYQNGAWGNLQQLTSNQLPDDNPQIAIEPSGHKLLTWLQGGALSSVLDFNFSNQQIVVTNQYSSNLGDFKLANGSNGRLAVLWAEPSQQYSSDLWGTFYDPNFGVWGKPQQLTADSETEMETATTLYSTNQLIALYDRVDIAIATSNAVGSVITNADLYVLQYRFTNDLALVANSLSISPANPSPGGVAILSVVAENLGDNAVSNVLVAFYQGDPASGGTEIGETNLAILLPPGATNVVSMAWTVPTATNALPIYAVIDPDHEFVDSDSLNNEAINSFVEQDLEVQSVTWSQITSNLLSLTATVINKGVIASQPATISFLFNSLAGTNLFSTNIESLLPGQSVDVNFIWNTPSLGSGLNLYALVDTGTNANFNSQNETLEMTIQPNIAQVNVRIGPISLLSDRTPQITVSGLSGQTYLVQASTNLTDWGSLTNLLLPSVTGQFIDSMATNYPRRFYRVAPTNAAPSSAPVLVASNLNNPNNLVLDSGYIYFADSTSSDGILKRVPTSGGTVTTLTIGLSTSDGHTPGVVVAGSTLYGGVGGYNAYNVFSLPASGGSPTTLTSMAGGNFLGVSGSTIYYSSGFSAINSIPTSGGSGTQLATGNWVRSYAMDDNAIYFCEYSSKDVKKFGLSSHTVTILASGFSSEVGVFMDTNNLFLNDNGNIWIMPKSGGTMTMLVSGGNANGCASDAANMYYLENNSIIKYIPISGGPPLDLTTIPTNSLGAFVLGNSNVYWSDVSEGAGAGKIWQMPKP